MCCIPHFVDVPVLPRLVYERGVMMNVTVQIVKQNLINDIYLD